MSEAEIYVHEVYRGHSEEQQLGEVEEASLGRKTRAFVRQLKRGLSLSHGKIRSHKGPSEVSLIELGS